MYICPKYHEKKRGNMYIVYFSVFYNVRDKERKSNSSTSVFVTLNSTFITGLFLHFMTNARNIVTANRKTTCT